MKIDPRQQRLSLDNDSFQLDIPFNNSRESIMELLKHGAEVEAKSSRFLLDGISGQIKAIQKS
jgi:proteasome accessory factor C